jgi:hypothetical protein
MKISRKLTSLCLTAAIMIGTSVTVFAAPNDDVITALKDAKVPQTYIIQAENYLKTTTITAAQATIVKTQINAAAEVAKAAGITDITKLSTADKDKLMANVTTAGKAIELNISFAKQSDGKYALAATDKNGKSVINFSAKEVKQTGADNTIIYLGALMIVLAAGSVFVLKRNNLKVRA